MGGSCVRTFETLPRVEPWLGAGSAGGRGVGAESAPGKARTLVTLPSSPGRRLEPPLGVWRAEGSPGGGRGLGWGGGPGRAAREKRRPESPRPGRLGERAEASRWVRVPGWKGVRAANEGLKPGSPTWPPHQAGGRRWTQGRGRGPLNFSWTRGGSRSRSRSRGTPGSRPEWGSLGGEVFKETKARIAGVGQRLWGLCADTCISRLWAFVDLGLGT